MTCTSIVRSKVGIGSSLTAPIKQSKHGFINKLSHEICKEHDTRPPKYHNEKPKFEGRWYLLVGDERKCKNASKRAQMEARGC